MREGAGSFSEFWKNHHYFETYRGRFTRQESQEIIDLHHTNSLVPSRMQGANGATLRDSDLFWIPRISATEWIFGRLWKVVAEFNSNYAFDLTHELGQAQLTRYRAGQHYEWHMDLGAGQLSLRKITVVVQLTSKEDAKGGGLQIFHGQAMENQVDFDIGDVVVFPSFVMHRASPVRSGVRWSLVLWLNGTRPLR